MSVSRHLKQRLYHKLLEVVAFDLSSANSMTADRVRLVVAQELAQERQSVKVCYADPLRRYAQNADAIWSALKEASNYVGKAVMAEDGVLLVGGKFPGGLGLRLGDGVRIYSGCRLVIDQVGPESGIVLGNGVSLNYNCYLEGSGGVAIGAGTIVGPNAVILSSKHIIDEHTPVTRSGKTFHPVAIGCDVWVGAAVVVLPGVTIGDRSVLGAGSVVTHDVAPGAVVAGNPARPLK
jgi:acetyltransferase-like isoleucine patch superfamily enzyme